MRHRLDLRREADNETLPVVTFFGIGFLFESNMRMSTLLGFWCDKSASATRSRNWVETVEDFHPGHSARKRESSQCG